MVFVYLPLELLVIRRVQNLGAVLKLEDHGYDMNLCSRFEPVFCLVKPNVSACVSCRSHGPLPEYMRVSGAPHSLYLTSPPAEELWL